MVSKNCASLSGLTLVDLSGGLLEDGLCEPGGVGTGTQH